MSRERLTDTQVEEEIKRLSASPYVKLARKESNLRYKRRNFMYSLRCLENKGKELAAKGITIDSIEEMLAEVDEEALVE